MKRLILKWLGIDELLRVQARAFSAQLEVQDSLDRDRLRNALVNQEAEFVAALAAQRAEFEARFGVVLDASITASEKIARFVAAQGDANVKTYIDECFSVFQPTFTN